MTSRTLIFQSFRHYAKGHLGLLAGAFLTSAILSGSLVVGDSVRYSLRKAASQRLGGVQHGLVGGDRWFTEDLAKKAGAVPVILMQGSVSSASGGVRANAVQVLGVDKAFWKLSPRGVSGEPVEDLSCVAAVGSARLKSATGGDAAPKPKNDTLAVNESIARRLNLKVGDTVLVRLEMPSAISRDAPLSGSTNQEVTLRRKVASIVSAEDLGRFQLTASQTGSDTVFVSLPDLQTEVEKAGSVNLMLAPGSWDGMQLDDKLALEDFALKLTRVKGSSAEWEVSSGRVFLDVTVSQKVLKQQQGSYGVLTYLVNGISSEKARTPYSMVTALPAARFDLKPDEAMISQWLAEDHQVGVGGKIDIRYFTVGIGREMVEQTGTFTVKGILPMDSPDMNRLWTPDFPGVSDVDNCRDWEPGIPVKLDAIRDKDEKYWDDYRGTPKAFIGLEKGQELWGNRFGKLTAIRFADTGQDEAALRKELVSTLRFSDVGLVPRDFGAEAAAAAKGSVDFGGLFIGLSLFLIAGALVFAALLFLFTLERRTAQMGLLLSIGWTPKMVRSALLKEAGLVAVLGAGLGLLGGVAYTRAALAGLNGIWSSATVGMQLFYDAQPLTFVIAFVASVLTSIGILWWASRKIFKAAPKDLLAGEAIIPAKAKKAAAVKRSGVMRFVPVLCVLLAIGLSYAGSQATNPEAIAGMFFGAGFLLLTAGLLVMRGWLRAEGASGKTASTLGQIGVRNVTRRPGRSLAVTGMMAGGIFLVIAVNAFRLSADADSSKPDSGTGGFALLGESTLPIYEDLNAETTWDTFALDEKLMAQAKVVPFRVREGDDASCLNLNRAQNPVLTAVNPKLLTGEEAKPERFKFIKGSWSLLSDASEAIPAIADQATAMWGLGKGVGDTLTYTDSKGQEFKVKLVGLLAGSVLQGKLIVSETSFLEKYPDAAGYKFFLIDAVGKDANSEKISEHLTKQLQSRGLALEPATARLAAFQAVQNTYIGIFTILGGLGVLLGTAGLGVLAARNILERRSEFGLMQAVGFLPAALRKLVLSEHVALLAAGLVLGLVSAAIAVWPNVQQSGGALPVAFLLWLNVGILAFGFLVCWLAARLALGGKLLDAVRRE